MLLSNAANHSEECRQLLKKMIFPTTSQSLIDKIHRKCEEEMKSPSEIIDPLDVPIGTIRSMLIPHMISIDTNLKRTVAEFLYLLCDSKGLAFIIASLDHSL